MTCRDFADFLLSYVDRDLEPAVRAAFEGHLAACPDCLGYLRQYVDTIAAAPLAFAEEDFADVPEALVHAILASQKAGRQ